MNKMLSYEFNIGARNIELLYTNGTIISIDCTEIGNTVATATPVSVGRIRL